MVVTHPNSGDQLCIGMDLVTVPELRNALEGAEASGCDFVVVPLVHPRYERVPKQAKARNGGVDSKWSQPPPIERDAALTRADFELSSGEWIDGVVGKFSPWLRPDAASRRLRNLSEDTLREEYNLASHLSLRAVLTPSLTSTNSGVNLARCINFLLAQSSPTQIWVRLPVSFTDDVDAKKVPLGQPPLQGEDALPETTPSAVASSWELWNQIRSLCDFHPKLGLALELTSNLPSKAAIERWFAEPVHMLIVSTGAFVPNKAGYPVLQRRHKDFITSIFRYKCHFAISGRVGRFKGGEGVRPFVMFLAHLFGKQPVNAHEDAFDAPYLDYLQSPLQPLLHNVEGSVYETFEKDPVKYARYQEAIRRFFVKRGAATKLIVAVLGAGRGPLVKATIAAAASAEKEIAIYAVEKNPHAVIALKSLRESKRWTNVKIVECDMRDWEAPERADLAVSELLGSFGDNELSPECLSCLPRVLKEDGVSIPENSISYLAPLCAHNLYASVRALGQSQAQFETPYVVKIHRGMNMDVARQCFAFRYPENAVHGDFIRHAKLQFRVAEGNVLHGFAGYFSAHLFEGVDISIRLGQATPGMFSWYPLFFPIENPMMIKSDTTLEMHIWRRASATKVWYEWCITSPVPSPVHNVNGRSSRIELIPLSSGGCQGF